MSASSRTVGAQPEKIAANASHPAAMVAPSIGRKVLAWGLCCLELARSRSSSSSPEFGDGRLRTDT
jgi:hypothetical protein